MRVSTIYTFSKTDLKYHYFSSENCYLTAVKIAKVLSETLLKNTSKMGCIASVLARNIHTKIPNIVHDVNMIIRIVNAMVFALSACISVNRTLFQLVE